MCKQAEVPGGEFVYIGMSASEEDGAFILVVSIPLSHYNVLTAWNLNSFSPKQHMMGTSFGPSRVRSLVKYGQSILW